METLRSKTGKDLFTFKGVPLLIAWRIGTMPFGEVT